MVIRCQVDDVIRQLSASYFTSVKVILKNLDVKTLRAEE